MLKSVLYFIATITLLSGCATSPKKRFRQLHVRFSTNPATAKLYMDGELYSDSARKDIYITLNNELLLFGTYILDIPEARWPSGTSTPQTTQTISLEKLTHTILIQHPSSDSAMGKFDLRKNRSLTVLFESNPPGALIHVAGTEEKSPLKKTIPLTREHFERGSILLPAAEAHWPSGSTTSINPLPLRIAPETDRHTVLLSHPAPQSSAGQFDALPSHSVSIKYLSTPSRALIFNTHENLGQTPVTKTYTYTVSDFENGYMLAPSMQAHWLSGAHTNSGPIKVTLNGPLHEYTFTRPEHSDLTIDINVIEHEESNQREKEAEEKRQILIKEHHHELESIEYKKLLLEQKKVELLKRKQKTAEKFNREMIRLRRLEIEKRAHKNQNSVMTTTNSTHQNH